MRIHQHIESGLGRRAVETGRPVDVAEFAERIFAEYPFTAAEIAAGDEHWLAHIVRSIPWTNQPAEPGVLESRSAQVRDRAIAHDSGT